MPVLTEPFGRRRLEVADDRIAVHRPGLAGLVLLRDDGHVLRPSRRGRWLTQEGTFSARARTLRVEGFDAAEIRTACLAAGWDWRVGGAVEHGSRPAERADRGKRSLVSRRWSLARRPKWPYLRRFFVELGVAALILAAIWSALWAASHISRFGRPPDLSDTAMIAIALTGAVVSRAVGAYRRAGRDDWVHVSDDEVIWHAADSAAFVTRVQIRTVVDTGTALDFNDSDGRLVQLRVPEGQRGLAEALGRHGWVVRGREQGDRDAGHAAGR